MEERLEQALSFANYRQTLNNQLQKLKTRAEGMLIFAKNGGSFTINRELICFLDYLVRSNKTNATLLDDNNAPVLIVDVLEFQKEITNRYFEVTNDYLKEYQEIRKSRNVKSVLDIKDAE
jgi:hypothetical protein